MSIDIFLQNFSFSYQNRYLFESLSLTLSANTCSCLLGPSGVGKSSLLHIIAGVDLGVDAKFHGVIKAADQMSLKNRVSLLSQHDALLPWLNVLENVLIGYRLRGNMNVSVKRQAQELLCRVGMAEEIWRKKPQALSGGMRQRVALVRTLLEDKPIWLMDEPFSALDALTRYKLQDLTASLWNNKTVLLVTHDPLEALRLGHHIYVLSGNPIKLSKIDLPSTIPAPPRMLTPELLECQNKIIELL